MSVRPADAKTRREDHGFIEMWLPGKMPLLAMTGVVADILAADSLKISIDW